MSDTYKHNGYTFIDKREQTIEDWLGTRREGVGGSDVGVIMDLNPYQSALEMFYDKLGLIPAKDLTKNDSIYWGRKSEEQIRVASEYWEDDDPLAYTVNHENGNQKSTHVDVPFFVINDKYPWLQANLDGFGINSVDPDYLEKCIDAIVNGKLPNMEKVVEIKTIMGMAADKWIDKTPPGYIVQVMTYLIVCKGLGAEYGEIFSRRDGVRLHRYPVPWNQVIADQIIEMTYDFQEGVWAAKDALKGFTGGIEEAMQICMPFEPSADSSPAYTKFFNDNHMLKQAIKAGAITSDDKELREMCIKYNLLGRNEKDIDAERKYLANTIREWMRKNNTSYVNFTDGGHVSCTTRLNFSKELKQVA